MDLNTTLFVVITILGSFIVGYLLVVIIRVFQRKKQNKVVISNNEFNDILNALGKVNNIESIERVNDRLRLVILNKELLLVNELSKLNIMATIKGLELTILYRKDSNALYKYIMDSINASKKN